MRVNVSQLLQEEIGSRRAYEFENDTTDGAVSCAANLLRTDAGILVHANCDLPVSVVCGRCLQAFVHYAHVEFDEEYFPSAGPAAGIDSAPRDEESFSIDEDHELDLWDAVRQYSILVEPMTSVCRAGECRGLCNQCGADRNIEVCQCRAPAAHPAFDMLRQTWESKATNVRSQT